MNKLKNGEKTTSLRTISLLMNKLKDETMLTHKNRTPIKTAWADIR